jgi:signal transduction histidine kinase/CheY-like chemotaxis protein
MATDAMLSVQTNDREKLGYKINGSFNIPVESTFGFHKDEETLRSVVSKAQGYVGIEEIGNFWTAKTFDYLMKSAEERSRWVSAVALLLIVALCVVSVLFVKNKKNLVRRKAAEDAAYAAARAKSAFLAHMSHEIRTPLNAIIGMANIAEQSISDREKTLVSIKQINNSSLHLLGILNDVLDMSKIESGKLYIVSEPFSVMEAYGEVADIIAQRCGEKNIRFTTNIDKVKELTLLGDKLRINQVVINLLSNAVKFTASGGAIDFSLTTLEETETDIFYRFSVADNGIGLSGEQIKKLFKPFEQADGAVAVKYGGTGLGLSISQNLINMMGGEIKVVSAPGEGSRFYFDLRFTKGAFPNDPPDGLPDELNLEGKRILLAEDVEINRFIVREYLSTTGVQIDEAEDGHIACDMFVKSPIGYYDLIFMDIQMPVMDGYETTAHIRKSDREDAAGIPIIAMTANAYKEDVEEALAAGMNGHLAKPIDTDELMKTLARFLRG